jgi:hypothetical protein
MGYEANLRIIVHSFTGFSVKESFKAAACGITHE